MKIFSRMSKLILKIHESTHFVTLILMDLNDRRVTCNKMIQ